MKSDRKSVHQNIDESAEDAFASLKSVFTFDNGIFDGFGDAFPDFLDNSIPKMTNSMQNSGKTIDEMRTKLNRTKAQFDHITAQRHPEFQKSKHQ